jgi:hypothetical protein
VADSSGIILTAAHVVKVAPHSCRLTILVPDDDWSRAHAHHALTVGSCFVSESLDIAACRVTPIEHFSDLGYLRPAVLQARFLDEDASVTVTGFWGFGLSPYARRGKVLTRRLYQRRDGVLCDFSTNVVALEGMSGSPVVSENGRVVGLITTAGTHAFSRTSFGISMEKARLFLAANALAVADK